MCQDCRDLQFVLNYNLQQKPKKKSLLSCSLMKYFTAFTNFTSMYGILQKEKPTYPYQNNKLSMAL